MYLLISIYSSKNSNTCIYFFLYILACYACRAYSQLNIDKSSSTLTKPVNQQFKVIDAQHTYKVLFSSSTGNASFSTLSKACSCICPYCVQPPVEQLHMLPNLKICIINKTKKALWYLTPSAAH